MNSLLIILMMIISLISPSTGELLPNKTLFLDNQLTKFEKSTFAHAAIEWNIQTKGCININVKMLPSKDFDNNSIIITKVSENFPATILLDNQNDGETLAYYDNKSFVPSIVIVNQRIDRMNLKHVALHEIGHALRIPHIKDKKALMNPSINKGSNHITDEDLKIFYSKYNCL